MPQRLAANQHGGLVQLSPGLILAAGVHLALVTPPSAAVNLVIRDVLDGPGMSLVDGRGILRPVSVEDVYKRQIITSELLSSEVFFCQTTFYRDLSSLGSGVCRFPFYFANDNFTPPFCM